MIVTWNAVHDSVTLCVVVTPHMRALHSAASQGTVGKARSTRRGDQMPMPSRYSAMAHS